MKNPFSGCSDREKLDFICAGLGHLPFYEEDIASGSFARNVECLVLAIRENRWDLIAAAANYMAMEELPDDDPKRLKEEAKQIAFYLSCDVKLAMNKTEILEYMERVYPKYYDTVPTSPRLKTEWWKNVGPVDQARGYMPTSKRKEFEASIQETIENHKNNIPKFIP